MGLRTFLCSCFWIMFKNITFGELKTSELKNVYNEPYVYIYICFLNQNLLISLLNRNIKTNLNIKRKF